MFFSFCPWTVFEGRPRNKQTIEATAGAVTGEATFEGKLSSDFGGENSNGGDDDEEDWRMTIEEEEEEEEDDHSNNKDNGIFLGLK